MKTKTLVLLALFGFVSFAFGETTLKQKLGSQKLAQSGDCNGNTSGGVGTATPPEVGYPSASVDWCTCEIPEGDVGEGAVQNSNALSSAFSQAVAASTIPSEGSESFCVTDCCACNEAANECAKNAVRERTFTINGSISVAETISFSEAGLCREAQEGLAVKNSTCVINNAASVGAPPIECKNITVCA